MRRRGPTMLALMLGLALIPGSTGAQEADRAAELEARQAERLRAREAQRPARAGLRLPWRLDPHGQWAPPYGYGPGPRAPYGWGTPGIQPFHYDPFGFGPGTGGYGPTGYVDPFAYRPGRPAIFPLPDPYGDWARLWGRGWLDDAEVPPYHRFQYRFFPETLPDPTREGYVTPGDWRGVAPRGPVSPPAGTPCARIDISLGEDTPETILVRLPALGAQTPAALRAVIADRLRSGAGVVLRDLQGYVVQLPAPESVHALTVAGCH